MTRIESAPVSGAVMRKDMQEERDAPFRRISATTGTTEQLQSGTGTPTAALVVTDFRLSWRSQRRMAFARDEDVNEAAEEQPEEQHRSEQQERLPEEIEEDACSVKQFRGQLTTSRPRGGRPPTHTRFTRRSGAADDEVIHPHGSGFPIENANLSAGTPRGVREARPRSPRISLTSDPRCFAGPSSGPRWTDPCALRVAPVASHDGKR